MPEEFKEPKPFAIFSMGAMGALYLTLTVFVHAENGEIIDFLRKECIKKGQTTPHYHHVSRPPFTEAEAVRRAIYIAKENCTR
ncbi:hypothetical protein Gferi_14935 [Geosporobacter ferrireducens]|uniref:Uncharacterized protein n=1 Tax=Geosporobacter ferrireducens TaxID=1424294 RepID=A0A1D8GIK6_9FIRM|nr:hypothetical protein Gferi_14935 [Geosporobacter ferrireducens]